MWLQEVAVDIRNTISSITKGMVYNSKMISSAEKVFQSLKTFMVKPSNNFQRILLKITDGRKY